MYYFSSQQSVTFFSNTGTILAPTFPYREIESIYYVSTILRGRVAEGHRHATWYASTIDLQDWAPEHHYIQEVLGFESYGSQSPGGKRPLRR
jgi:hypothetical protein